MRILSRYILNQFLRMFFLCEIAFVCIYLLIDFFERIGRLLGYGGQGADIALYFIFKIPKILFQVSPVAVLIGAVVCMASMNRRREITAIEGHGIPLLWASIPVVAASMVISLALLAINEYVVPFTDRQSSYYYYVKIKGYPPQKYRKLDHVWYQNENRLYNILYVDPDSRQMKRVTIFFLDEEGKPLRRIDAESAYIEDGAWRLNQATERRFANGSPVDNPVGYDRLSIELPETYEDMVSLVRKPDEMNYRELKNYIAKLSREGFETTEYKVDICAKISIAFIAFIMGIIGVPLGLLPGHKAGPALSLGIGVIFGIGCWFLLALFLSLGKSGILPPVIAAWSANIIYLVFALILLRLRRSW